MKNVAKACTQHLQSHCLPLAQVMSPNAPPLLFLPHFPCLFPTASVPWECLFTQQQIRSSWEQDSRHNYISVPHHTVEVGHVEPGFTFQSFMHQWLLAQLQPKLHSGAGGRGGGKRAPCPRGAYGNTTVAIASFNDTSARKQVQENVVGR